LINIYFPLSFRVILVSDFQNRPRQLRSGLILSISDLLFSVRFPSAWEVFLLNTDSMDPLRLVGVHLSVRCAYGKTMLMWW